MGLSVIFLGSRAQIISSALASHQQIDQNATAQPQYQAEEHRAKKYRGTIRAGQRTINNKGPCQNNQKAQQRSHKSSYYYCCTFLDRTEPERQKERYGN